MCILQYEVDALNRVRYFYLHLDENIDSKDEILLFYVLR